MEGLEVCCRTSAFGWLFWVEKVSCEVYCIVVGAQKTSSYFYVVNKQCIRVAFLVLAMDDGLQLYQLIQGRFKSPQSTT